MFGRQARDPAEIRRSGQRASAALGEPKLAALSRFTRALIEKRGRVDADELGAFSEAGFKRDQVLELIAGLAVSVMANYAGNITHPDLESRFAAQAWRATV